MALDDGVTDGADGRVNELLAQVPLIDHHAHSLVRGAVDPGAFSQMLTESDRPAAAAAAGFDSQLAFAVRRWCAPLLGLAVHAPAEAYLGRRSRLTNEEAATLLLPHAGLAALLVDTGYRGEGLIPLDELGRAANASVERIFRLETLAERVAVSGASAGSFAEAFRDALAAEATGAVGLKSIIAYRGGLDFDPDRPSDAEVEGAAGRWLTTIETARGSTGRAPVRLVDRVLLRFVLWEGALTGKPLQVHTGYGDPDLELHRSDPSLMTEFLRRTESTCPVMLLHTYPYQRTAGYLAQMFPHVYLDVGLAVNHSGAASAGIVAETLEVAPFTKLLFSSDAWGIPELHLLGSWLFRRAMARVLGAWVAGGDWSRGDAERVITLVASENAQLVYGLEARGGTAPQR